MQLHVGLFQFCVNTSMGWLEGAGRLYPLSFFLQYPFFYLFKTPIVYQAARLVFISLSLISSAWLIQLIFRNIKISLFFLLIIPALWSIRAMSDPLTSYAILLPALTLFVMLSLSGFIKSLESKNHQTAWLVFSLIAYFCAVMTYELGIVTFFCILLIARLYSTSSKNYFLKILPHLVLTLLYAMAYLTAHHYATGEYNGTTLGHLDLNTLLTFLYQLTASLPLNYGIFSGHCFKPIVFTLFLSTPFAIIKVSALFIIAFFGFYSLFPSLNFTKRQRVFLLQLGIVLNVIPALLIASTIKYQAILAWGLGYLPVYIQYLGTACIGLSLLGCINTSMPDTTKKRNLKLILACLFAVVACLSLIFNTVIVKRENLSWQDGRSLEVQAINAGLLSTLPTNAILVSKDQWTTPAFYLQYGNIKNQSIILINTKQILPRSQTNDTQHLLGNYPFPGIKKPYHIVGTLSKSTQGFRLSNPRLVSAKKTSPLFFMKYTQIPYALDGTGSVSLGKITQLDFSLIGTKPQLTGLTVSDPKIFAAKGSQSEFYSGMNPQNINISWHCFRKFDLPPTSFNQLGHVNICSVP